MNSCCNSLVVCVRVQGKECANVRKVWCQAISTRVPSGTVAKARAPPAVCDSVQRIHRGVLYQRYLNLSIEGARFNEASWLTFVRSLRGMTSHPDAHVRLLSDSMQSNAYGNFIPTLVVPQVQVIMQHSVALTAKGSAPTGAP